MAILTMPNKEIREISDLIINFESGDLTDDEAVVLFQYLIDTGLAWSLQGIYGRTAQSLIEGGYCTA
jgi:hypothetical protein